MLKIILAFGLVLGLTGCLGSGGGGDNGDWNGWKMDPRLADIAAWAHAAGAIVVGVDAPSYIPPVQGVNGMWGNNVFGTYYGGGGWRDSFIRTQIDRPTEKHVQDIIAHEIGHFYKDMTTGNPSGETYANWVNREIRKLEAEGLIPPAPGIDWDAVDPVKVTPTVTGKPRKWDLDEEPVSSPADDKD